MPKIHAPQQHNPLLRTAGGLGWKFAPWPTPKEVWATIHLMRNTLLSIGPRQAKLESTDISTILEEAIANEAAQILSHKKQIFDRRHELQGGVSGNYSSLLTALRGYADQSSRGGKIIREFEWNQNSAVASARYEAKQNSDEAFAKIQEKLSGAIITALRVNGDEFRASAVKAGRQILIVQKRTMRSGKTTNMRVHHQRPATIYIDGEKASELAVRALGGYTGDPEFDKAVVADKVAEHINISKPIASGKWTFVGVREDLQHGVVVEKWTLRPKADVDLTYTPARGTFYPSLTLEVGGRFYTVRTDPIDLIKIAAKSMFNISLRLISAPIKITGDVEFDAAYAAGKEAVEAHIGAGKPIAAGKWEPAPFTKGTDTYFPKGRWRIKVSGCVFEIRYSERAAPSGVEIELSTPEFETTVFRKEIQGFSMKAFTSMRRDAEQKLLTIFGVRPADSAQAT